MKKTGLPGLFFLIVFRLIISTTSIANLHGLNEGYGSILAPARPAPGPACNLAFAQLLSALSNL